MFQFDPKNLIYFRQLAVMTEAGLGLLPSLQLLAAQSEKDEKWAEAKTSIVQLIEGGLPLSQALARQGKLFTKSQIVAIKSAERAGALGKVLQQLERKLMEEQVTKARLRKALSYPAFLILLSLSGSFLMFKYVLPGILNSTSTGSSDFLPTKILVLTVSFINSTPGLITLSAMLCCLIALMRSQPFQRTLYFLALEAPFLGDLLKNAATLEFAVNLKLLIGSGTPIASAVEFGLSGSESPALNQSAKLVTKRIMGGDSVVEAFGGLGHLFSPIFLDMMAVIDETSEYGKSLGTVIDFLKFDVEQRVDQFLTVIEPTILLLVSGFVGFVALAVVVPIIQLGASL